MTQNQILHFSLKLSYEEYFKVYQGLAKTVSAVTDDGRRIVFPARNIQAFLTKEGIQGYFEMTLTAQNKFLAIKRLR